MNFDFESFKKQIKEEAKQKLEELKVDLSALEGKTDPNSELARAMIEINIKQYEFIINNP